MSSLLTMDITSYIVQGRDQALLYGDYATYHSQLSKRLLNTRKKLGVVTKNRGKFHKRDHITAENIGQNRECDTSNPNRPATSQLTFLDMSTCPSLPASALGRKL